MLNPCTRLVYFSRCGVHTKYLYNENFRNKHFSQNYGNSSHLNIYNYINKNYYKLLNEYYLKPLSCSHLTTNAATYCNNHIESESKLNDGSMSVSEATKLCMERFKAEDIPEAELHAAYIVGHIIGVDRNDLSLNDSSLLSSDEIQKLNVMMECRLARMPLQYIIGNWDFHSITLKLHPPVFIPRMETEELVELALKELNTHSKNDEPLNVLDVCCGSGAIALAILKNNTKVNCIALDKSKYAIDLSAENAKDLGLSGRLKLIHAQITNGSFPEEVQSKKFDLIVCNPPYVPRKETLGIQREILLYEDMQSIDGGDEGLEIIKPILRHCQHLLSENGAILMEVDPRHSKLIPEWLTFMEGVVNLKQQSIYKDVNGLDRFLKFVVR